MILVLMGVSGIGKTTIGRLIAARTGWIFEDADDYHSEANRAKMASGTPLTDADRLPWLRTLHDRMAEHLAADRSAVLACSALRAMAREQLQRDLPAGSMRFVLLHAPAALIAERIQARQHQYMNPNLLPSQLATLEEPEEAWRVSVEGTPEQAVEQILTHLSAIGAWNATQERSSQ